MIPINTHRTDSFFIHWYDSDCFGRLSFPGFARFLEESAWRHANELGFGLNDTLEGGVVWVIVRLEMEIIKLPCWGDSIAVRTWPRGVDRLFAYREFEVTSSEGDILAKATSTWIVIDREERKAVKPSIVDSVLPYVDKIKILGRDATRLGSKAEKILLGSRTVVFSDLDTNGHVNNCKYLEWVIDLMPFEVLKNLNCCNISLNFNSELLFQEIIDFYGYPSEEEFFFEGVGRESGKCVFIVILKQLLLDE